MEYSEFKERFINDIKEKFPEEKYTFGENKVKKVNESYDSFAVTPKGNNVGVNIPVSTLFEAVNNGKEYKEVLELGINMIEEALEDAPEFNVDSLLDYNYIKERLVMEVISTEANEELLKTIPHTEIEDMSIIYRFVVGDEDEGRATIVVTNIMLEHMKVSSDQLKKDAKENAQRFKPIEIKGICETLAGLMWDENGEKVVDLSDIDEKMYVASVNDKIHGAAVFAYDNFKDKVKEVVGNRSCWVLPSSIHEILLIPDENDTDLSVLEDMVREVNATQVAPSDILTNSVYHFDLENNIFELGRKYEERKSA